MKLKWKTLASGTHYVAETPLGVPIDITKTSDRHFRVVVGPATFPAATFKDANAAKHRVEELYCTMIKNEYERVCK